jgi:DNA-binding MarR family transcriptional regulator
VRELVADLISEGVNASVSQTIRETVQAVASLPPESPQGVSLPKLAKALNIDKSAVSRRAKDAESKGYLANLEDQKGKAARLVVSDPLPEDAQLFPAAEHLECCSVADGKGGTEECP